MILGRVSPTEIHPQLFLDDGGRTLAHTAGRELKKGGGDAGRGSGGGKTADESTAYYKRDSLLRAVSPSFERITRL